MIVQSLVEKIKGWKKVRKFEEILALNGCRGGFEKLARVSSFEGLLSGGAFGWIVFFLGQSSFIQLLAILLGFFAPFGIRVFYQYFLFDNKRRKIESILPDFLLEASLFPPKSSLAEIIGFFAKRNYPFLSQEFQKASSELEKGASADLALSHMKKRIRSRPFSRAIELLIEGTKSGADASIVFKEAAEDQLETNSLLRERKSMLVVEKYTLLFAGGVIVPLILGTVSGMLQTLDFSALSEIGVGLTVVEKKDLLWAGKTASFIYIIEYALIASFFLAFQEHDYKKSVIYAAFLLPISLGVYFFSQIA